MTKVFESSKCDKNESELFEVESNLISDQSQGHSGNPTPQGAWRFSKVLILGGG